MLYKDKDQRVGQELTGFLRNKTIANVKMMGVTSYPKYRASGMLQIDFTDGASFVLSPTGNGEEFEFSVFFAEPLTSAGKTYHTDDTFWKD